jgi:hypothetical protein
MLGLHAVGRSTREPDEPMSNTPLPKFIGDPFGSNVREEPAHDTFPAVDEVERLTRLRAAGVTSATFHTSGVLASVSFEPSFTSASAAPEEEQHDPSTPVKRERRSTGGLVPRGPTST